MKFSSTFTPCPFLLLSCESTRTDGTEGGETDRASASSPSERTPTAAPRASSDSCPPPTAAPPARLRHAESCSHQRGMVAAAGTSGRDGLARSMAGRGEEDDGVRPHLPRGRRTAPGRGSASALDRRSRGRIHSRTCRSQSQCRSPLDDPSSMASAIPIGPPAASSLATAPPRV